MTHGQGVFIPASRNKRVVAGAPVELGIGGGNPGEHVIAATRTERNGVVLRHVEPTLWVGVAERLDVKALVIRAEIAVERVVHIHPGSRIID